MCFVHLAVCFVYLAEYFIHLAACFVYYILLIVPHEFFFFLIGDVR